MTDEALSVLHERAARALADYLSAMRNSAVVAPEDIELAYWWMRRVETGPYVVPPGEAFE